MRYGWEGSCGNIAELTRLVHYELICIVCNTLSVYQLAMRSKTRTAEVAAHGPVCGAAYVSYLRNRVEVDRRDVRLETDEPVRTWTEPAQVRGGFGLRSKCLQRGDLAVRRAVRSGSIGVRDHMRCRSEEHTSELQSLRHLVCRLLRGKKKTRQI